MPAPQDFKQQSVTSHIPSDARGVVNLSMDGLYAQIYAKNRGTVEADTNHGDKTVRVGYATTIPARAKAGVGDVFLEIGRDHQPEIDAYMKTSDAKALTSYAAKKLEPVLAAVYAEGGKINAWAMDLEDAKKPATAALQARADEFGLEKKLNDALAVGDVAAYARIGQEFSARYAKETAAHQRERQAADEPMSQFVADVMSRRPRYAKYSVFVGLAHTDNHTDVKGVDNTRDMDELCAAKIPGGCVQVALHHLNTPMPSIFKPPADKPYILQREQGRDVPEFVIALPDERVLNALRHPRVAGLSDAHKQQIIKLTDTQEAFAIIAQQFLTPEFRADAAEQNRKKAEAAKILSVMSDSIGALDFAAGRKHVEDGKKRGVFDITNANGQSFARVMDNYAVLIDKIDHVIDEYNAQDKSNNIPLTPGSGLTPGAGKAMEKGARSLPR